jgi:hypothetical protein
MGMVEDPRGTYFTIQNIRANHESVMQDVEFIVVDNRPGPLVADANGNLQPTTKGSKDIKDLLEGWIRGNNVAGARYIPYTDKIGSAPAKNKVFAEASGLFTLNVDCHVTLFPGSIERLLQLIEERPDSKDLWSGPMVYDNLNSMSTHVNDYWRGEMWGVWGQAWQHPDGFNFSVMDVEPPYAKFVQMIEPLTEVDHPDLLSKTIENYRHEQYLFEKGCRPLGYSFEDEYDIPGHGCGLFAARTDYWNEIGGFNELFSGFGGEEMYLQQKFIMHGGRSVSFGFLKWLHCFLDTGNPKNPNTKWDRVRNYVIGVQELNKSLDPVYEHFVASGAVPENEYNHILASPRDLLPPQHIINSNRPGDLAVPKVNDPAMIDHAFDAIKVIDRDLNQHMDLLRNLASQVDRVTEFSGRRESLLAFIAAKPASLISHNTELGDPVIQSLTSVYKFNGIHATTDNIDDIQETDLLFLDAWSTAENLLRDFDKYAPKTTRWIAMHDTVIFGTDNGNQRGMISTIREFVKNSKTTDRPWFVAGHTTVQYGLTVLGCQERDRPKYPIRLWGPGGGPGTELKLLLHTIGVTQHKECDCNGKAAMMDQWGVEGCEEHFDEIVKWIEESYERWGWKEAITKEAQDAVGEASPAEEGVPQKKSKWRWAVDYAIVATKAVTSGVAFRINPTDLIPSLVRESIRLAKKKAVADYD